MAIATAILGQRAESLRAELWRDDALVCSIPAIQTAEAAA
jgi:hypothetical protein